MQVKQYSRQKALEYSRKWAYLRNPAYYNYDPVGGDCTNFISQCIYSGIGVMNYDRINGWYYNNGNDKSASWTGVEFLYKYLIKNNGIGPFGKEIKRNEVEIGDIVQLSFDGIKFGHSLFIVNHYGDKIFVATHTFDSFNRDLDSYSFLKARYIKIDGYRIW